MTDRQALHDLSQELSDVSRILTNVQIDRDRLRGEVERLKADNDELLKDASVWRNRAINAEQEAAASRADHEH